MKFEFIDTENTCYEFQLDIEPDAGPHIKITVKRDRYGGSSTAIRPIISKKVLWWQPEDHRMVSSQARLYIDKVIKNLVFC